MQAHAFAGLSIGGFCDALVVSAWLERFMTQGFASVVWNYLVGTLAGAVLYCLAALLPHPALLIALALMAALSAFLVRPATPGKEQAAGREPPFASEDAPGKPAALERLLAVVMLTFFALGVIKMQSVLSGADAIIGGAIFIPVALQALASIVAKVVASYAYVFRTVRLFHVAVPALSISAALLVADGGMVIVSIASMLVILGSQLVAFLVIFKIAEESERGRMHALTSIGWLNLMLGAGPALGRLATPLWHSEVTSVIVTLGCMIVSLLVVMGDPDAFSIAPARPVDEALLRERRATDVARHFGLTEREKDVLELWSQGHTSSYIQEQLSITKNTVKTHTAHIYEKTGVSSKEELLQLVEGFEAATSKQATPGR